VNCATVCEWQLEARLVQSGAAQLRRQQLLGGIAGYGLAR
jgi:hypothetical protein